MVNILNLSRLINGEILTNPSVSVVENFATQLSQVSPKSAFIAFDKSEIDDAINRGAYAVIFEGEIVPKNGEIAYIKVADLAACISRIGRYFANLKELKFIEISTISRKILENFSLPKSLILGDKTLQEFFLQIIKSQNGGLILSEDKNLILKFSSQSEKITPNSDFRLLFKGSIFYSSFIFDEHYYPNLYFPRIFLPDLCGILEFLKKNRIEYKFSDLRNLGHFEPIFVDKFFKILPFGASEQVFIFENDREIFKKSAEFLRNEFSQNIVIAVPWNENFDNLQIDFRFSNLSNLRNLSNFHYVLIFGIKDEIYKILDEKDSQKLLF